MFGDENQNKLTISSSMKIAIVDNEGTENELYTMIFETIKKEYVDKLKISYIYNINDLYKNSLQSLDEKSEGLLNSQWIEEISTLRPSVIILYYYIKEGSTKEDEEIKISKIIDNILLNDKYVYIYLFVVVPQQEIDIYQHLKDDEKSPNSIRKKLNKEFIYIFPSKEIWKIIEVSKLCNSLILCSRNYYKQLRIDINNKRNESMHSEEIIKYDILMGVLNTIKSKKQEICVSKHLKEAYDIICTKSFDHKKYLYGNPESTKLNFCEIRGIADWLLFKIMKFNFKVTENYFEKNKKNPKMVVKQKNLDVKTKIDILSTTPINKKISLRKSKSFQNIKNNPEKIEFEKQMNEIKKNIKKYSSMTKLKIYYNNLHQTSNLLLSSSKISSSSSNSIHSSFKKSKNENLININNKQQKNNYDIKLMKDPNYSSKIKFSLITKNKNTNSELNLKNSENSNNNNSGENKENSTHYDLYEANEELKPGEVIELYNGENLLCKKIDFEKISAKNNFELNNKNVFKNKKTEKLLNSFIDENDDLSLKNKYIDNSKEKNINQKESQKHYSISKNKNENILNKNNCSSFQSDVYSERNNNIYSSIIYNSNDKSPKRSWNKFLIINNNNSFQINSSYENFNLISQNKLIEDNTLQIKMKNYLLSQIRFLQKNNNISNKFSRFKSLENIKGNNYYYKKDFQNTIITKNKRKSNDNSIKTPKIKDSFSSEKSIDIQSNKAKIKNRLSLIQINGENDKKSFSQKYLLEKIINTETNINEDNKLLKEFQNKKEVTLNPIPIITRHKTRRRRGSILDKINFNMQKRNQNLNNPDVFYSHYFNSIIIGELSQKQNNNNNIVADSPPINGKLKSSNEKSINKNS